MREENRFDLFSKSYPFSLPKEFFLNGVENLSETEKLNLTLKVLRTNEQSNPGIIKLNLLVLQESFLLKEVIDLFQKIDYLKEIRTTVFQDKENLSEFLKDIDYSVKTLILSDSSLCGEEIVGPLLDGRENVFLVYFADRLKKIGKVSEIDKKRFPFFLGKIMGKIKKKEQNLEDFCCRKKF